MKHIRIALATTLLLFIGMTNVNAGVFGEGSKIINVGIGLGSPYVATSSSITIPPIHASYEQGLTENISLGGLIGYTASSYDAPSIYGYNGNNYKYTYNYSYLLIGVRGAYHYEVTDQFDIYGGVMLGYNIASESFSTTNPNNGVVQAYNDNSTSSSAVTFSLYGGARYMFNEHVGAFAELGYNIAYLSIGVSFKL